MNPLPFLILSVVLFGICGALAALVVVYRRQAHKLRQQLRDSKKVNAGLHEELRKSLAWNAELNAARTDLAEATEADRIAAADPYEQDTMARQFASVLRAFNEPSVTPPHEQTGGAQ